jgi:hypothetical protein
MGQQRKRGRRQARDVTTILKKPDRRGRLSYPIFERGMLMASPNSEPRHAADSTCFDVSDNAQFLNCVAQAPRLCRKNDNLLPQMAEP